MNRDLYRSMWMGIGFVMWALLLVATTADASNNNRRIKSVSGDNFMVSYLMAGELEVIESDGKTKYRIHSPSLKTRVTDPSALTVIQKKLSKAKSDGYMDVLAASADFHKNLELGGCKQGLYEIKMFSSAAVMSLVGGNLKIPKMQFMTQMECIRAEM